MQQLHSWYALARLQSAALVVGQGRVPVHSMPAAAMSYAHVLIASCMLCFGWCCIPAVWPAHPNVCNHAYDILQYLARRHICTTSGVCRLTDSKDMSCVRIAAFVSASL